MDISVERERQQQRNADRLRELAMKNRGVREDVERKRAVDPRERGGPVERGMIPERGMLERERLLERPLLVERTIPGERELKPGIPLARMLERDGRQVEMERTMLGERESKAGIALGRMLERDGRPVEMERTMLGERESKAGVALGRMLERDGRPVEMERTMLGEREAKAAIPLGRLLDRDGRSGEMERTMLGEREPKATIPLSRLLEREGRPGEIERTILAERDSKAAVPLGRLLEREVRPVEMERSMLGEREPRTVVPLARMLEREGRSVEMDRTMLGEREPKASVPLGRMLERDGRSVDMDRTMLGEREPKAGVPLGRMLERDGRSVDMDRTMLGEREPKAVVPLGRMLERDGRSVDMDRTMLGEREPKPVVPLGRMLERDGRPMERDGHRDLPHVVRGGNLERLRHVSRERDDERPAERIREGERDAPGSERVSERDSEREESLRELVSSYKSALAELTFNSKPIITNLTIIAGENSHAAKGISSTVFNHIMEVPKEQKLPSLYLLDSIVKNIGGDYIKYFAARLPEVFCMAYRQVDPSTNPAMQHLFRTWRGVFPPGPLRLIENELHISSSAPNGPSAATPPARPTESHMPRTGHESPMPRTGHGIHVNPKYLEAQRQRLQQTGQAESNPPDSNGSLVVRGVEGSNLRESSKGWSDTQLKRPVPARGKREEYTDTGFGREAPFDFEYDDYGSSDRPNTNNQRKSAPGRIIERDEGWEPGYFRDGDGEGFGHEEGRSSHTRYGSRNGYDWRQPPSRSTDIDGYGYNRGPGPGRGSFHPGQTAEGPEGSRRGTADNWLKTDEEEYIWEDMSPRLRPPPVRDDELMGDRLSKDDWYPSESDRGNPASETGRLKRTSQDAGFADAGSWRRTGPGGPMEQSRPAGDRRQPKEYDERRAIQASVGRESGVAAMDQNSGGSRTSMAGPRLHSGWPSQANTTRNLSPPARSRPVPLQLSVPNSTISPTARSSSSLLPRAGTPPTPSNGVGPSLNSGHFESRQTGRPNLGNFGGGSPTYSNLSPVTPAPGLPFQQRQQSHRHPPSPTQLSALQSNHPQPPINSSQQQNQQLHLQLQHEQSSHLLLGRHQMQMASQLQSSVPLPQAPQSQSVQQVPPSQAVPTMLQSGQQSLQQQQQHLSPPQGQSLQQGSQIPALQQSQQLPGLHQAQVPVHQQQLHQPQTQQLHHPQTQLQQQIHHLSAPLLPLISSQLAQSLQQLAQQAQQAQQVQQSQLSQQSQTLTPQQPPQTSQSSGVLQQALAPVPNGSSAGLVQTSESQSSNNNLLAAFLRSGLIPPSQSTQILPQSQSVSSTVTSTSIQQNPPQSGLQGQPPLPSGPPPTQFSNSIGGASAVQVSMSGQMTSGVATTLAHMTTFAVQPPRFTQPPLPPGPPPASTIVGSGTTSQPVTSGGVLSCSISSLLSSLVAHGVIAPVQKNLVPSAPSPPMPASAPQPTTSVTGFVAVPPTPASPPSTTVPPAPVSTVVATSVSPPTVITQDIPPSPRRLKQEAIGVDFKQELLKERHEYVLEALYSDFPRQCKTCGLRFKAQDEHSKHMDWHVSRNRRQKSQKKVSRKWFVSAKEWFSGTAAAASESAPSFFAEEPGVEEENNELVAVPADENQSACALCGELFEDFYSDETDEWMYKGAVYLNVPQGGSVEGLDNSALGPIVHMKCKTESAETANVDSAEDDDEVQPELQAADSVRMEVDGMGEDNIMPLLSDNFDMSEIKDEQEDLGSRRKRTRY